MSDDNIVPFRPNIPDRELKEGTIGERTRGGQIIRAKRRTRILELRAAGLTEYQIAEELDMSQSAVSRTINSQLDEWMQEDANHVERIRAMKLYELDQLKRAVWAKALKGDLRAVQQATKIVQAQARIAGAEAPRKVETKTEHSLLGIDADEVARMERAWAETRPAVDQIVDAEVVEAESRVQPRLPFPGGERVDEGP